MRGAQFLRHLPRDCVSSNESPSLGRSVGSGGDHLRRRRRRRPVLEGVRPLFFAFFGLFLLCRVQCIAAMVAILVDAAAAVSPSLLPPFSWHKLRHFHSTSRNPDKIPFLVWTTQLPFTFGTSETELQSFVRSFEMGCSLLLSFVLILILMLDSEW